MKEFRLPEPGLVLNPDAIMKLPAKQDDVLDKEFWSIIRSINEALSSADDSALERFNQLEDLYTRSLNECTGEHSWIRELVTHYCFSAAYKELARENITLLEHKGPEEVFLPQIKFRQLASQKLLEHSTENAEVKSLWRVVDSGVRLSKNIAYKSTIKETADGNVDTNALWQEKKSILNQREDQGKVDRNAILGRVASIRLLSALGYQTEFPNPTMETRNAVDIIAKKKLGSITTKELLIRVRSYGVNKNQFAQLLQHDLFVVSPYEKEQLAQQRAYLHRDDIIAEQDEVLHPLSVFRNGVERLSLPPSDGNGRYALLLSLPPRVDTMQTINNAGMIPSAGYQKTLRKNFQEVESYLRADA